jgi:hypothetical protein
MSVKGNLRGYGNIRNEEYSGPVPELGKQASVAINTGFTQRIKPALTEKSRLGKPRIRPPLLPGAIKSGE